MGSLFGGYLSQRNEVWLIDVNKEKVEKINRDGVVIREQSEERIFYPKALTNASALKEMDLVILFVKALYSKSALAGNPNLVGKNTYVMTLQNGAGHEETLLEFISKERIVIGTTQHNSSVTEAGRIHHGGGGRTSIGLLEGDGAEIQFIADNFSACGFETVVSDNIKRQIWGKLFLNVSASVLTAILQVKLGYLLDNPHGRFLTECLVREAVEVANAEGMGFNPEEVLEEIQEVLRNARDGYTSIYADIRDGVHTEVDTISGSIVREARRHGIRVPSHEFVVELIHAIEDKTRNSRNA
jgi:2-dehydropantoate 2-reductase